MSFFHKKMSQNVWATIMPFGPVTLIFYWPQIFFSDQPKLALISGTECGAKHHNHNSSLVPIGPVVSKNKI